MKVPSLSSLRHVRRGPTLVAGVAVAVAGFANAAPAVVHAGNAQCVGSLIDNVVATQWVDDPTLTLNSTIAPGSTLNRDYGKILEWCIFAGAASGTGRGDDIKVVIVTKSTAPVAYPTAANDAGWEWNFCVNNATGIGQVGRDPVVIGAGHFGGPLRDGPYPNREAYKNCAAAVFSGNPVNVDCQVFQQNPSNLSTFLDTTGNNLNIKQCSWAGNIVTLYVPQNWNYVIKKCVEPSCNNRQVQENEFPSDSAVADFKHPLVQGLASEAIGETGILGLIGQKGPAICEPTGLIGCVDDLLNIGLPIVWDPGEEQGVGPGAIHVKGEFDLGLLPEQVIPGGLNAIPSCVDPANTIPLSDNQVPEGPFPSVPNILPAGLTNCILAVDGNHYDPCFAGQPALQSSMPGPAISYLPATYQGQDNGDLAGSPACPTATAVWNAGPGAVEGAICGALGANCTPFVGNNPPGPVNHINEYDNEYGVINLHDLPCVPGVSVPACDHLLQGFDTGTN